MTCYSVQPRDMDFCLLSKILSGSKYSHKTLDHAKQSATDAFKTASKRLI